MPRHLIKLLMCSNSGRDFSVREMFSHKQHTRSLYFATRQSVTNVSLRNTGLKTFGFPVRPLEAFGLVKNFAGAFLLRRNKQYGSLIQLFINTLKVRQNKAVA